MSAMFTQTFGSNFEQGGSFGTQFASMSQCYGFAFDSSLSFVTLSSMSSEEFQQFLLGFQQLPMSYVPMAFVTQNGYGSYDNFRGNNFKGKGKGKMFYSGPSNGSGGQYNSPFPSFSLNEVILKLI